MNDELQQYRARVEAQVEELSDLLAQVGLASQYDIDIRTPEEDEPLAPLFVGLKVAADNLQLVSKQLEDRALDAEEKARIIAAQQQAIQELSTPVIEIWEGVVVLPLIGTIDSQRAKQIMAQLLDAISSKQASVAIIDITGVPVLDTFVASHLRNTAEAAKMLGARYVLTGVSPNNAQALIKAGMTMESVETRGTLRAGLASVLGTQLVR